MAQGETFCLPMQETPKMQIGSLGWEDTLEEDVATHSSILPWRIPWTEEWFGGSQRVRHWSDLAHKHIYILYIDMFMWKSLSHVWLFVTPWSIHPWNSPGQNTGVGSFSLSRASSHPRDRTQVSHIAGGFFTSWATREAQIYLYINLIFKQFWVNSRIMWKAQQFLIYPLTPLYTYNLPCHQHPPPEGYACYTWWTYLNAS